MFLCFSEVAPWRKNLTLGVRIVVLVRMDTLPGFRALYPEECAARRHIFDAWRSAALCAHFHEYDTPVLEPLEVFTEKSGEEIASQLFAFEDKGGRKVAMRPEMTPSVARLVGAKANSLRRPIKWFNIGEQYRYERPQKGRLRAFYQFNADIFGVEDPTADAEAIALMVSVLQRLGFKPEDVCVKLSDRRLWVEFLEIFTGMPEKVHGALSVIDKLERESHEHTRGELVKLFGDKADGVLQAIQELQSARSLEAVREVLSKFIPCEKIDKRLADWQVLLDDLNARGLAPYVVIDLSVVRGLLYYTGFVFEAFERSGKSRALAGGGRYDDLLKKLTGVDMPAVGFAAGDVTIGDLLREKNLLPDCSQKVDCFLVAVGDRARSLALNHMQALRAAGVSADVDYKRDRALGKQLKQADACNAKVVLVYGDDELASGQVRLQHSATRDNQLVALKDIVAAVQDILI